MVRAQCMPPWLRRARPLCQSVRARHRQRETMAGGGGKEEGYVKRLLRAHSEEGDDRVEEERRTMVTAPSKEDSWVLRKKASFESMWGGGGSQSLSLCLPKQDYYLSKSAKEEKQGGAFQVVEKVNEVENPVKTVIEEEEAAATVRAVAKEIEADTDEIFGGADKSSEAHGLFREDVEDNQNKDTGLDDEEDGTGSQSDSEEKGGDGLNEEAGEEEVPTPAEEEAVTLVGEKEGLGGCITVPEGGAVDTVTREEAIR